jgi:hypothetical protein
MRRIAISTTFLFIQLVALGGSAGAHEATRTGVSVGVGLEQDVDGSVTAASDASATSRSGHLDLGVLGNVDDFAIGGAVAWVPDIFGDGRLVVGARAGWQPTFGTTRVQVLGDAGIHRFTNVRGGFFSSSTPSLVSTPYVGCQIGMTRTFVRDGHLEYGLAVLVRSDLAQQTVTHSEGGNGFLGGDVPPTTTELHVGGTMVGAMFTLGFRVEKARRSNVVPSLDLD